jgi:hypothetical protein
VEFLSVIDVGKISCTGCRLNVHLYSMYRSILEYSQPRPNQGIYYSTPLPLAQPALVQNAIRDLYILNIVQLVLENLLPR